MLIIKCLTGTQDDRDGILDTIIRNKSHYQKRAYQCIKCLVCLFNACPEATQILRSNPDFSRKYEVSVAWLHEELDRRPFTSGNQYNYDWSPPAPSNDSSNSYYLERSPSARLTLKSAVELLPEEQEKHDTNPEPDSSTSSQHQTPQTDTQPSRNLHPSWDGIIVSDGVKPEMTGWTEPETDQPPVLQMNQWSRIRPNDLKWNDSNPELVPSKPCYQRDLGYNTTDTDDPRLHDEDPEVPVTKINRKERYEDRRFGHSSRRMALQDDLPPQLDDTNNK